MDFVINETQFRINKNRGRPPKYGEETAWLALKVPKSLKLKLQEVTDNMTEFIIQAIEDKLATIDEDYEQKLLEEIEETRKHLQHLEKLYEEIQHRKLMAVKEEITSRLNDLINAYRIYEAEGDLDEKKLKYYKDKLEYRIKVLAEDLHKSFSEVFNYVKQLYPDVKILEDFR